MRSLKSILNLTAILVNRRTTCSLFLCFQKEILYNKGTEVIYMNKPNYQEARVRTKNKVNVRHYEIEESAKQVGIGKKYYLRTYGCQMNEHDSENICAMLEQMGFTETNDVKDAELVLLNTCSIRENAHNKAYGMLGRLKHMKATKKDLIVGLCGCMAQEEGVVNTILAKYKWVNFVFGTHNLDKLPEIITKAIEENKQNIDVVSEEGDVVEDIPVKRASTIKAYVNIIYGCDKFCTYCIVPYTRGKQRSRRHQDILKEVNELKDEGYQEVTLLGQNVNAYGKDLDDNYGMEDLLEDVAKTGIPRIRFVTSHPWDFTDRMIEVIAKYPNIMKSVHLPVQSGSSRILKLMGRRYTKEEYISLFDKLRKIPNMHISTDIIVGFPGETEEDFEETLELAKYCKFDNAYTFIFSEREGTPACKLPNKVPEEVKEERLQRLNAVMNQYFLESNQKLLDKEFNVLVDGKNETGKTSLSGYLENNKLINFDGPDELVGKVVKVKVTEAKTWSLNGKLV